VSSDEHPRPKYTRYRARPRLPFPTRSERPRARERGRERPAGVAQAPRAPAGGGGAQAGEAAPAPGAVRRRRRARAIPRPRVWPLTRGRVAALVLALVFAWLGLSLLLFLISSHFERTAPPADVARALDPAGYPLTSANNILVLGSDRRPKGSKEPGANTSGPSRSDSIMLIRTGGGHAARLSIPRDTVVEIPGHGLQKINAAYAFGGPALSIEVIKRYLGVPINHLVEVNFEDFPQLIDAMGGVDYRGDCVVSRIDGGFRRGGYTLRLHRGTNHLDGKAALALARTRENLCRPHETDLQRAEHQQELFSAMRSRLLSFGSFIRLPLIAWNAPPAIISDMSGETLLGLFAALGTSGTPPTRILKPSGGIALPDGESGLVVSESERRNAARAFESG
jgi:LCP family protein required for cell wall assembly